jgi:hypothetical protein
LLATHKFINYMLNKEELPDQWKPDEAREWVNPVGPTKVLADLLRVQITSGTPSRLWLLWDQPD